MRTPRSILSSLLVAALGMFLLPGTSNADVSGIPGAPVRPYVSERGTDHLVVVWSMPSTDADLVSSYEVRYSGDAGTTWAIVNHADTPSLSHMIDGLSAGVNYVVEIRSNGVSGSSDWVQSMAQSGVVQVETDTFGSRSCALLVNGKVKCWSYMGQGPSFVAVEEPGFRHALQVSANVQVWPQFFGYGHVCALLPKGTVKCLGMNNFGQLGDGTTQSSSIPVDTQEISTAVEVSAGGGHTCVRLSNGTVQCWGENSYGQLGDGTKVSKFAPATVSGIETAVQLSSGQVHSCALLVNGTVQCWGDNSSGQLGDGTTVSRSTPVTVSGISTAVQIASGLYHSCALLADGNAKCWGNNSFGQLGDGTTMKKSTPVLVAGISSGAQLAAGDNFTCARLADGTIQCWGANSSGQLGDGTTIARSTPVDVLGVDSAIDFAAGGGLSCAVVDEGKLKCWGQASKAVVTADPPVGPGDLSASSLTFNSLHLEWSSPDADGLAVDKYKVEWSINGTSWIANEVTSANATLTGLASGTAYQVRVSAHSDAGWGAASTSTFSTLPVLTYATGTKVLGVTSVGKSLTVANGTWTAAPKASYTYQWYSCTKASKTVSTVGKVAAGCKPISRATASTLKLTTAHKKLYMAVLITGKNTAGSKKVFTATVGPVK